MIKIAEYWTFSEKSHSPIRFKKSFRGGLCREGFHKKKQCYKNILRRIKDGDADRNRLRSQAVERRRHRKNHRHGNGDRCHAGKKPHITLPCNEKYQGKNTLKLLDNQKVVKIWSIWKLEKKYQDYTNSDSKGQKDRVDQSPMNLNLKRLFMYDFSRT